MGGVDALLTRLSAVAPGLHTVPLAASAALEAALHVIRADAATMMLPDEGVWRVSSHRGLRALETRLVLDADHWLMRTTLLGPQPARLTIQESDIARSRLAGTPLANRRHLMAIPLVQVQGLMLLARSDPPYQEKEAATASAQAAPFQNGIATALQLRELARDLEDFLDYPD